MRSVYEELILTRDINELMSNGAYSTSRAFGREALPEYKCHNGKVIRISSLQEYLCEIQCKVMLNANFGFEMSLIKIKPNQDGFFGFYCATDYNYIRFEVCGWQYEMVDGYLDFVIQ